jgi:tetratricopeptide (TPR) repeat protein
MRLAEEGIYDDPAMSEMVDVFNRPYNLNPKRVYTDIVSQHPDSPLAPIAQLKLAMWYAFNKKYPEGLTAAQDLIEKYPDSPLVDKARTLGDSVFARAVPGMLEEERYGRIVRYWETYDFIGKKDSKVDDNTRLAIATSYWKIGQPDKALEMLKPYLAEKQIPGVSDQALGLAVNIYLDQLAWQDISDLVSMASKNWTLKPEQQRQLDYARAMALQNLGDGKRAVTLWAELAKDTTVDPAFRAYAMYYMAKDAMERQDLRRVFVYAQEALSLLLQTDGDPEKIKDAVLMSIYATERSGRYEEALKWAKEYDKYISVDNPEWASTRFKLARIYRKAGAMDEWKQLLQDIIEKKPDSLQAQLAKSALDTYDLEQKASQYAPNPG